MRHSLYQDRDGFHVLVEEFALPTDTPVLIHRVKEL